ncbi:ABC-three component system middle component 1 [Craterilacuibacter sp. RT1T]|uniref:ABC-three component system middle component 1 n=1 Tax=Craterilacuibacter sp. RT1T TaxID=2942211 RepID=UPI0020C147E4|nr:ABC-three component system middle component 1 [Craterilacuibacter sp. RT1T]MCL6262711.1 SMC family ATPase [Craterilacuibacter sp. RT1T]
MQQYSEALSLPSELRDTLTQLMVGATFTEETLRDDCLPLLLMMRGHAVTAFAIGNGTDYERQYEAFKKHYLKRSSEWSAKDVSFVYCIPANITVHESFRSSIEVDVYFCRKYVVQLDQDLVTSLARLPFLPLSPITPGVQTRPPSAQTLLQQRKLKAELASALVVPAKSSPRTILDACLEGDYGDPSKFDGVLAKASVEPPAEERVQATLKSISIQNFRAYRTMKTFELGSAITVLYGPNGFGKTSFFDAIDFAVTGGVGRLAKASGGLARAAKHLDSGDDESTVVTLTLERDGQPHVITRNLVDHNNAQVDGQVTSRKDVLSLLTGGASATADRVDNMVALFRATHLFSQDSQELTRDVAEKCELPADIVSRMLAFEDYVSGLKKAEEVLKLARQTLADARMQAQNARSSIDAEREDLKRLEGLASVDTSTEALDARFTELEQAISTSGFNVSGISPRDTRALRAVLESFAAEAVRLRATVSKALEQVANLKTQHGQLESMRTQLEERKVLVEQAEVSSNAASERLGALTSELAQFKTQEQALKNRRDWWAWAVSVQPEYARLIAQSQALTEGLATLTLRLNQQKETQSKALNTQQDAAVTLQRLEAALKTAGDSRSRAQWVKEQAGLWVLAEPRLIAVQALEAKLQGSSETKSARLAEAQQVVLAQELLVARVERELSSARSNETTLKQLIAELRTHVDGATCLLCGHDHGTHGALLAAIDRRMEQGDLIVQLNETLATERGKLQTLLAARQALIDELSQDEQQLGQAKVERESLEQQRMAYEMALRSAGLSLSNDTAKQLEQISSQTHEAEMLAASAVNDARQLLEAANTALGTAQDGCQTLEREHQTSTTALKAVKRLLDEVLADANRGMVNLGADLQSLSEALQDADARLVQASSSAHTASTAVEDQKAVNAAAKATLAAARTNHQQAVQALNTCQTNVQSLAAALKAAGLDSNVSHEQLHQRIQAATTREVTALGLRDRVAELEVAVDTAATSAAFQSIFDRILVAEKLVEQADERAQKVEPWVAYFEDVTKLLGSQQAVATEHFITEYGPRTAVIQQRLRPVYGFGEVEVSSKGSAISIRVHRKGKELRPTDYFSQSQVQTLVLGLFLTACSSQTWSGFSSIMMDDPVTHFDDLNTYALLDLILGLQSSQEGERQFVISTCDEKLLQLARQKFRHMGAAAKFYRFSAIGAEGPMVNEIPA